MWIEPRTKYGNRDESSSEQEQTNVKDIFEDVKWDLKIGNEFVMILTAWFNYGDQNGEKSTLSYCNRSHVKCSKWICWWDQKYATIFPRICTWKNWIISSE